MMNLYERLPNIFICLLLDTFKIDFRNFWLKEINLSATTKWLRNLSQ